MFSIGLCKTAGRLSWMEENINYNFDINDEEEEESNCMKIKIKYFDNEEEGVSI